MSKRPAVVVVGAGGLGAWAALRLQRLGCAVTLIDAWGPGNSRSSSGGETRVLRGMYGADRLFVEYVARSVEAWQRLSRDCGESLYVRTGALWLYSVDDDYARASLPLMRAAGLGVDELTVAEVSERYPQIDLTGVRTAFVEHEAGYLLARRSCAAVVRALREAGGSYRLGWVRPDEPDRPLDNVVLRDGERISADRFVFACGPWMGEVFPQTLGSRIVPTRQEVFYFGSPAGDLRFHESALPVWLDMGERIYYGIPGSEGRGFKVADDTRGPAFDPTAGDRTPSADAIRTVRECLTRRFPALRDPPLLEARVCQYENSPDGNLIVDRHPDAENVVLVAGGSGHGFKLSPAVAENVVGLVVDEREPHPELALARFRQGAGTETQFDHT